MARKKTTVFVDIAHALTLRPAAEKKGRRILEADLGVVEKPAIVVQEGKIVWLGPRRQMPKEFAKQSKEVGLQGRTLLPGFVECHTHSLFAGSRSQEFEMRLRGVSYQEIAARGGGILSTMRWTREASAKKLKDLLEKRTQAFVQQGVTTLEVKTGYALDLKNEIKSLQVINSLETPRVVSTFLGAHSKPPEFATTEKYLEFLQNELLPKVKKLTKRVDIWIEKGFFEKENSLVYLTAAKKLGFDVVVHADQLSLSGGTDVAVELGASSADHVIQLDDERIKKIAKSETTAVLLPAADLYMKCPYPPARKLIDAGARVALATDFNPGSCPTQDLSLVGLLARLEMRMTLPEVIAAYTVGGAYALGLGDQVGSLEVGKYADFSSIDGDWTELFYSAGALPVKETWLKGQLIARQ